MGASMYTLILKIIAKLVMGASMYTLILKIIATMLKSNMPNFNMIGPFLTYLRCAAVTFL